jgi:hypothetical protein
MEQQRRENLKRENMQTGFPQTKVYNAMSGKTAKFNGSVQKVPAKPTNDNKDMNFNNMPGVNGGNQTKVLKPIYPDQSQYQNQMKIQNTEHVNKQYQLEDIVRKAHTTVNFINALNTMVVKPAIEEEVTTRKPIIAPVTIKTPVNFFEGQPLSEEDLIVQNFFKNTTPVAENSEQYYKNVSLYNKKFSKQQQNNENILAQTAGLPNPMQNVASKENIAENVMKQYVNQDNTGKTKVKKLVGGQNDAKTVQNKRTYPGQIVSQY